MNLHIVLDCKKMRNSGNDAKKNSFRIKDIFYCIIVENFLFLRYENKKF